MKASLSISHVLVNSSDTEKIPNLELIIELKRFSTLTKLLRVTAYVIVLLMLLSIRNWRVLFLLDQN